MDSIISPESVLCFNTGRCRLIKRGNSCSLFDPKTTKIVKLSHDLYNFLLSCNGGNSIRGIAKQLGILEHKELCLAVTDFVNKGYLKVIKKVNGHPNSNRPIKQTVTERTTWTTMIFHVTSRCNLNCEHCYIKSSSINEEDELSTDIVKGVIREFAEMSGLFLDITGGEPLLRKDIFDILHFANEQILHLSLLSNGVTITEEVGKKLRSLVHQVTVSLDGLEETHNSLRGTGSYYNVIKALRILRNNGIPTATTTVISKRSLGELSELQKILQHLGVSQWNLVVPRLSGRLKESKSERYRETINTLIANDAKVESVLRSLNDAAKDTAMNIMVDESLLSSSLRQKLIDGIGPETEKAKRVCWDNVITILPSGHTVVCVFFNNLSYGNVRHKALKEIYFSSQREYLQNYFHQSFKPGICPYLCVTSCNSTTGVLWPKPFNKKSSPH